MAMRTGRVTAAAVFIGLLTCAAALGQHTQPGDKQAAAYDKIASACQVDAARFCPPVDQAPTSPRDQAMCLKTYHADLSLPCRHAVKAATTPAP